MKKKLEQKVAIVTGGARGLGKGIVISLLKNGCKVIIFDENESNGARTKDMLNAEFNNCVIFFKGNVALKKDNIKAVETAINTFGRLDIICANAGIFPLTWIKDISENEWDHVMNINLKGPFFLLQSALDHFIKNKYGKVVFTSSITGTAVSASGHAHYAATKSGLIGLVKTAAVELSQYNININAIVPGNIMSEGMKLERGKEFIESQAKSIPFGRLAETEEIGNVVSFLASDESSYITGQGIIVDGGQTAPENQDEVFHPKN
jgi:3-oxoacyl-[acyl-carrier protein] reductase